MDDRVPWGTTPLSDEKRVFVECVQDILAATPGLRYGLILDRREIARRDPSVYALFLLETNPGNPSLSIELSDRAFVVRVNHQAFRRQRGSATRFECWVDRRCRDLERLLSGDLRLVHQTLIMLPMTSTLEVGDESRWHKIGSSTENGWVSVLLYLLPYGFLMGGRRTRVYSGWRSTGDDP